MGADLNIPPTTSTSYIRPVLTSFFVKVPTYSFCRRWTYCTVALNKPSEKPDAICFISAIHADKSTIHTFIYVPTTFPLMYISGIYPLPVFD